MGFDAKKFSRETWQPRVAEVEVPELAAYYGDGPAVWPVRGLTGEELFRVRQAGEQAGTLGALAEALAAGKKDLADTIKELAGVGEAIPEDYTRRIEAVLLGSVEPVERGALVKLGQVHPVVLTRLADKIFELTGLGQQPGKPKGSGETPASATP